MKTFRSIILAAAMLGCGTAAAAADGCEPTFLENSQTINVSDIDVSVGGIVTEAFQIRIRNAGDARGVCSATLRVARASTSPSPVALDYNLRSESKLLDILPSETTPGTIASDLFIAQAPSGPNGRTVPFLLSIPADWGIRTGQQTEDLLVMLVDATGNVTDTMHLIIVLTVPPSVEVRVVGATGASPIASVELGVLDPARLTVSDPFGVRVWSTSPYTITFQSENTGRLKRIGGGSAIDYQLWMDGTRINVAGQTAAYVPQATGPLGDLHPLSIRVKPFSALAGDYSDRISVTVTAS